MKQIASGASQTRSYFLACESWKMKPACCNVIWYTSWCVPLEGYAAFFRIFEQKFKDLCWRSVLPGHIWSFRMRTVTFPGCNLYTPQNKNKKDRIVENPSWFFSPFWSQRKKHLAISLLLVYRFQDMPRHIQDRYHGIASPKSLNPRGSQLNPNGRSLDPYV